MAIRDIFKINRKTFINPTGWIDLAALKEQNRIIWDTLSGLWRPAEPTREETFSQALKRMKISETDLNQTGRNYRNYALLFAFLGVLTLIYTFYLLIAHTLSLGWIIGIATAAVFFSQAFRYDFWAYQIKERRLGVTFEEWKRHWLGNKGKSA